MSPPLVGVTGPGRRGAIGFWSSWLALVRAGARPRRLRPPYSIAAVRDLSAVVIGGGSHIEPRRYDQLSRLEYAYDVERDEFEWHVIEFALERRLPLLGICRGAQLLNVVLGGSLWQNLEHDIPGLELRRSVRARKWVSIESDSVLAGVMRTSRVRVNSLHRQAIKRLGTGLRVAARDADGIVQAIEIAEPSRELAIGVQWHPEFLPGQVPHQRLFAALVAGCGEAGATG